MLSLLAGLGNPGPEYAQTRHNAGFWLVDELARQYCAWFRHEAKFHGEVCRITLAGQPLWLLKPTTFMNRSGGAVASLAHFYKLPLAEIAIAHDELDLPVGTVRLKRSGGHGGHNGVRDVIQQLGSGDFIRLRFGIGHPGVGRDVVGYALSKAPTAEQRPVTDAIADAVKVMPDLVAGQWDRAVRSLHSRKLDRDFG